MEGEALEDEFVKRDPLDVVLALLSRSYQGDSHVRKNVFHPGTVQMRVEVGTRIVAGP